MRLLLWVQRNADIPDAPRSPSEARRSDAGRQLGFRVNLHELNRVAEF